MSYKNYDDQRACWKRWYKRNKEKEYKRVRARRRKLMEWMWELKSQLKCENCGENHISCILFHHKNPKKKDIEIGDLARIGYSKDRILKEIKKCKVLCWNCHRKLHWKKKNSAVV